MVLTPSPESGISPGEAMLALRIVTVPEAAPAVCGLNQTWNVIVWLGESEKPGEISEKPNPAPVIVTPLTVMLMSPVFLSVTFCVPVASNFKFPKLMAAGEICRAAKAFSATPARETDTAAVATFVEICREADRFPDLVGTKATL